MFAPDRTESEASALTDAVRELARRTHFPVSFGAIVHDGNARIGAIYGNRTRSLDELNPSRFSMRITSAPKSASSAPQ